MFLGWLFKIHVSMDPPASGMLIQMELSTQLLPYYVWKNSERFRPSKTRMERYIIPPSSQLKRLLK